MKILWWFAYGLIKWLWYDVVRECVEKLQWVEKKKIYALTTLPPFFASYFGSDAEQPIKLFFNKTRLKKVFIFYASVFTVSRLSRRVREKRLQEATTQKVKKNFTKLSQDIFIFASHFWLDLSIFPTFYFLPNLIKYHMKSITNDWNFIVQEMVPDL